MKAPSVYVVLRDTEARVRIPMPPIWRIEGQIQVAHKIASSRFGRAFRAYVDIVDDDHPSRWDGTHTSVASTRSTPASGYGR